jgi:amino acid transporter
LSNPSETSGKRPVFVREATGLVRSVGPFSGVVFAIANTGYFYYLFFAATIVPDLGNATDVLGGALIATVGVFFLTLVYYYLSLLAPRTGGDYVWISRWLHPVVGFVSTAVGVVFVEFLYIGVTSITVQSTGLAPLLAIIGSIYHEPGLISFAPTLTTTTVSLIMGTFWIWVPGIVVLLGARAYFKMQNAIYVILFIAMAALLGTMAVVTSSQFASSFNSYATAYSNSTDYYNQLITSASNSGWTPPGTSLLNMLLIVPILIPTVGFGLVSYIGGEMKNKKSTWAISLFGGSLSFIIFVVAGLILSYHAFGFEFMSAVGYLLYNNPGALTLPATPYISYLASIATAGTPILLLLINLAVLQQMVYAPVASFATSRALFAFSFDRILPEKISSVNEKWNSPTYAVLLTLIASEVMLFFFSFPFTATYAYSFTAVAVMLGVLFPYVFLGLVAIIFPYRFRDTYENSIIKGKIAGVPKVTWAGLITFVFMSLVVYAFLTNPTYGANTPIELQLSAGAIVASVIIYGIVSVIRNREGIPLSRVFAELPPE